jgi:hypothetical protein
MGSALTSRRGRCKHTHGPLDRGPRDLAAERVRNASSKDVIVQRLRLAQARGWRCQVAFSWRKACRALSEAPMRLCDKRTALMAPSAIRRRKVDIDNPSSAAVSFKVRTRSRPSRPPPSTPAAPRRSSEWKDIVNHRNQSQWLSYCAGNPSRGKCPQFREAEAAHRRCARRFRLVRSRAIKLANVRACCCNFALLCGLANSGCASLRISLHPSRSDLTRPSRLKYSMRTNQNPIFPR